MNSVGISGISRATAVPRDPRFSRRSTVVVRADGPSPLKAKSRRNEKFMKSEDGSGSKSSSKSSTSSSSSTSRSTSMRNPISSLADNIPDPILRAAVKEPIAFWGGVFAGSIRLDLDQDPLKSVLEQASGGPKSE